MNIQARQLFYLLVCLVVLLCASLFGIGYAANAILGKQATKLSKLKADNEVVNSLETALAHNKQDIKKYKDLNDIARAVVPQDKDQAEAVREIVNLASQSGIANLSSINFPDSSLGTASPGSPAANPTLSQLIPVPGVSGVYQLPITIAQTEADRVPYSKFITFLSKLEQNRRTAQVSTISVQPSPDNLTSVSFTLTINEFIKP